MATGPGRGWSGDLFRFSKSQLCWTFPDKKLKEINLWSLIYKKKYHLNILIYLPDAKRNSDIPIWNPSSEHLTKSKLSHPVRQLQWNRLWLRLAWNDSCAPSFSASTRKNPRWFRNSHRTAPFWCCNLGSERSTSPEFQISIKNIFDRKNLVSLL